MFIKHRTKDNIISELNGWNNRATFQFAIKVLKNHDLFIEISDCLDTDDIIAFAIENDIYDKDIDFDEVLEAIKE